MERKKCLQCNSILVGRTDKKFCNSTCRSRYYYSLNAEFNSHKTKVHDILRKNRNILAELNPTGTCMIEREILEKKCFNFNFFTAIYRTKSGYVYWYCYDYGFRQLKKNGSYQLVKWQPFMDQCTHLKSAKYQ